MNQHLELFAALAQAFEPEEVKVRPQGGRQLQYITARTVMNRLDDILGPANWWDEYLPQEHSVICRLTIRLPDGTTLTKSDAGGYAGMSDSGDDDKSGFSDAFKRAAVKFGIGRYLYRDGVPRFLREQDPHGSPAAEPHRPGRAPARPAPPTTGPGPDPGHDSDVDGGSIPQTGKALFAWIKQQEEKLGPGLLRIVSEWGQGEGFPSRMVQWNGEQVRQAYAEAGAGIRGTQETAEKAGAAPRGVVNGSPEVHDRRGEPPQPARPASASRSTSGHKADRETAQSPSSRSR
jgi:hypothetical protein